jgi:hypothetical protein
VLLWQKYVAAVFSAAATACNLVRDHGSASSMQMSSRTSCCT